MHVPTNQMLYFFNYACAEGVCFYEIQQKAQKERGKDRRTDNNDPESSKMVKATKKGPKTKRVQNKTNKVRASSLPLCLSVCVSLSVARTSRARRPAERQNELSRAVRPRFLRFHLPRALLGLSPASPQLPPLFPLPSHRKLLPVSLPQHSSM
jgi:hypothetical protein